MDKVMRIMRGRVASESGSVGVLVAFVIFLVMGMLTMTWNTAQISKTKMRLQNAADSAALAHAVWQARGMNVVQNINDEMYEGLSLAVKLRKIAEGLETAAQVLDALAHIPYVGWIFRGLAVISHTFAALAGGAGGWVAARVCKYFLKYLVIIYAKGAALFGIWNAQQLARQNEADPLAKFDTVGITVGIYSIGFSYPLLDAFMLPLEASGKSEVNMAPWKVGESQILGAAKQPWKAVYQITGGKDAWAGGHGRQGDGRQGAAGPHDVDRVQARAEHPDASAGRILQFRRQQALDAQVAVLRGGGGAMHDGRCDTPLEEDGGGQNEPAPRRLRRRGYGEARARLAGVLQLEQDQRHGRGCDNISLRLKG